MLSVPEGVVILEHHHAAILPAKVKIVVVMSLGLQCWADRLQIVVIEQL